jgi:hypothetical protein
LNLGRLTRTLLRATGIVALAVLAYLILLAFPEPLFACSVTYSNFTFYSHSPLPEKTSALASAVAERLAACELYDASVAQRIFVVDRPALWNLLNGPYRRAMARNVELRNSILVPSLDVESGVIRHFDGRESEAVGILVHETVHTLVQRRLGVLRVWQLAWWQREGYSEYIAGGAEARPAAPARYRQAARIWKHLLEDRHLTFDQVIRLQAPPTRAPAS